MNDNTQARKWLLTINNPKPLYSQDIIKSILESIKTVYWCMSDEIGEEGTYHTHLFLATANGIRFRTLKKLFPTAHIDMCIGSAQQNTDYVKKEGKWASDKKKGTNLSDTYQEFGEMPVERTGKRNDLEDLYDMIRAGQSNFTILETNPEYMMQLDKIDIVRQTMREEQYKNTFRTLEVTYIHGITETGKTRGVLEKYGYTNVYRVTDYKHPFDGYKGQDVILFEEFRDSLKIENMLNYLDGYPLELPSRYNNKYACYTKVFLASNWTLPQQYKGIQSAYPLTWDAFTRRIHQVIEMNGDIPHEWGGTL